MDRFIRRLNKSEKGQGLVEFAIVLPVLLFLILGIIEFAWLFNAKVTINSAAREGARTYAVSQDTTRTYNTVVESSSLSGLIIISVDAESSEEYSNNDFVGIVEVQGEMKPLVGLFFKENVKMSSIARMRLE